VGDVIAVGAACDRCRNRHRGCNRYRNRNRYRIRNRPVFFNPVGGVKRETWNVRRGAGDVSRITFLASALLRATGQVSNRTFRFAFHVSRLTPPRDTSHGPGLTSHVNENVNGPRLHGLLKNRVRVRVRLVAGAQGTQRRSGTTVESTPVPRVSSLKPQDFSIAIAIPIPIPIPMPTQDEFAPSQASSLKSQVSSIPIPRGGSIPQSGCSATRRYSWFRPFRDSTYR
jgi:hypothetical protein